MRGLPSMAKGVRPLARCSDPCGGETSSLRGPWVQIPPPAFRNKVTNSRLVGLIVRIMAPPTLL